MIPVILPWLLLGLALFCFLKIDWNYPKRDAEEIEKMFAGRKSLTREEFYVKYFKDDNIPKETVFEVIQILEDHLETDMSRLQKEDSFATNLSYFWVIDDMASIEIVMDLEHSFSIKIEDEEARQTFSINDIVQLVHRKVEKKKTHKKVETS